MSNEEDIARAHNAQALLNNELLQEAFQELQVSYYTAWKNTKPEDTATRERLFLSVGIVDSVKRTLEGYVAQGVVTSAKISSLYDNNN